MVIVVIIVNVIDVIIIVIVVVIYHESLSTYLWYKQTLLCARFLYLFVPQIGTYGFVTNILYSARVLFHSRVCGPYMNFRGVDRKALARTVASPYNIQAAGWFVSSSLVVGLRWSLLVGQST